MKVGASAWRCEINGPAKNRDLDVVLDLLLEVVLNLLFSLKIIHKNGRL
jgi:hypothetical protein